MSTHSHVKRVDRGTHMPRNSNLVTYWGKASKQMWIDNMNASHFLPPLFIEIGQRGVRPSREAEIPIWSSLSHCRQPLCHGEPPSRSGWTFAAFLESREGEKSGGCKTWCGRSWMPTTILLNKSIHYPTNQPDCRRTD